MICYRLLSLLFFTLSLRITNAVFQPEQFISENGKLDVTLEVDLVTSLDGTRVAPGYNGNAVGPTIRVKPGDLVTITLKNNLEPSSDTEKELFNYVYNPASEAMDELNVTIAYNSLTSDGYYGAAPKYGYWGHNYMNLHIHGASIDPKIESLQEALDGGESRTYVIKIPEDQPPVFAWYHNHVHSSAQYSSLSGLAGAFIIEGTDQDIMSVPEVADATEVILALSESKVDETGKPSPSGIGIVMDFEWEYVTNGELGKSATMNFVTGETVLFRAIGASSRPPKILSIDGHMFLPVAYDGYVVTALEETDKIDLHAGSRVEFMITFDKPGTYTMQIAPWNIGIAGPACDIVFGIPLDTCLSYDKPGVALTIIVEDSDKDIATSGMPRQLPDYHPYLQQLADKPSVKTRELMLSLQDHFPILNIPYDESVEIPYPALGMGLNGRVFTPFYIHGEIELGTCETWIVKAEGPPIEHTFHVHSVPFLVTNIAGIDQETPFWRDTFPVLLNATLHVCFPRHDGDIMVHCHMPAHLEIGMGGIYKVIAPSENEVMVEADGDETTETDSTPMEETALDEPIEEEADEVTSATVNHVVSMARVGIIALFTCIFFN